MLILLLAKSRTKLLLDDAIKGRRVLDVGSQTAFRLSAGVV